MKLLLTSSGIANASIRVALERLLGKPTTEASALVIPTAIYPFSSGPTMAARLIRGEVPTPLVDLGWASVGLFELTSLPSIAKDTWVDAVRAADALLFWGGDPVFLAYWMHESGLKDVLHTLQDKVYVGVSAGAIASASLFAETYSGPRDAAGSPVGSKSVLFETSKGEAEILVLTAHGAGLVDFAVIPHFMNERHYAGRLVNVERWAGVLPVPVYAIDDQTALIVVDGVVEVVSEGEWKRLEPS